MTYEKFDELMNARIEKLRETGRTKGRKYAGDTDRLENFKREGRNLDLPPEKILHVFIEKHLSAVAHFCRTGISVGEELVENHINDALMYLFLLEGLVVEAKQVGQPVVDLLKPAPFEALPAPREFRTNSPPEGGGG